MRKKIVRPKKVIRRKKIVRKKREAPAGTWIDREKWLQILKKRYDLKLSKSFLPHKNSRYFLADPSFFSSETDGYGGAFSGLNYFSVDQRYPPVGKYAILFSWFVLDDKDDEDRQIIVQNHDILDRHFSVDRLKSRMREIGVEDVDDLPYSEERRFTIQEKQRQELRAKIPYQFDRIKATLLEIVRSKVELFERAAVGHSPGANFREFVGWTVLTTPEWGKETKRIYGKKR